MMYDINGIKGVKNCHGYDGDVCPVCKRDCTPDLQARVPSEEEEREDWRQLGLEIKEWFKVRDIDCGYTDTHCMHFATYIQDKIKVALDSEKAKWFAGEKRRLILQAKAEERQRIAEIVKVFPLSEIHQEMAVCRENLLKAINN
jgi:hypothetical protein